MNEYELLTFIIGFVIGIGLYRFITWAFTYIPPSTNGGIKMCVTKLDKKTLDKICNDAIDAGKSSSEKEVKSYEKKIKERNYESKYLGTKTARRGNSGHWTTSHNL